MSVVERAYHRILESATLDGLTRFDQQATRRLQAAIPHFEPTDYTLSYVPLLVPEAVLLRAVADGAHVVAALTRLVERFLAEHEADQLDEPIHRLYRPYRRWWDFIAGERRSSGPIRYLRFDGVLLPAGSWRCLEANASCPGGTIEHPLAHEIWLDLHPNARAIEDEQSDRLLSPSADSFVLAAYAAARTIAGHDDAVIAGLNYRGVFDWDIELWRASHRRLRERGLLSGEFLCGDIRELTTAGDRAVLRGQPLSLIINKLDRNMIDPADPAIAGWVAASRLESVEYFNSLGSTYIAGPKRSLIALSDPTIQAELALDPAEIAAIRRVVPETLLLADTALPRELHAHRERFIVKNDGHNGCQGLCFGVSADDAEWLTALAQMREANGVAQRLVAPPEITLLEPGERGLSGRDAYYNLELSYFDAAFAHVSSAASEDGVFNASRVARLPVFALADRSPQGRSAEDSAR